MATNNAGGNFVSRIDLKATNLGAEWARFRSQFHVYCLAKGIYNLNTEDEKIANLIMQMGPECLPIYEQFYWNRLRPSLDRAIAKFDDYFEPVKNLIYERSIFNRLVQAEGQSINEFITSVQVQSDNCQYPDNIKSELIRDRIVVGVRDPSLRQYLIDVENLDLTICIRKAKQYTTQREQMKELEGPAQPEEANMDTVARSGGTSQRYRGRGRGRGRGRSSRNDQCYFCGKEQHAKENCPARNATCHKCKLVGHWSRSRACKGKEMGEMGASHSQEGDQVEADMDGLFLGHL